MKLAARGPSIIIAFLLQVVNAVHVSVAFSENMIDSPSRIGVQRALMLRENHNTRVLRQKAYVQRNDGHRHRALLCWRHKWAAQIG